jgi:thymidine kinase
MQGSIELIIGPMFCGKSTELLRRIRKYEIVDKKCICIKYSKDNRYEDVSQESGRQIKTHDKVSYPAIVTSCLHEVMDTVMEYDVIGIDEGQFFGDLDDFCEVIANKGKVVIIAALDGDFRRRSFGKVCDLIPRAEDVIKLKAMCMNCKQKEASFTKRLTESQDLELIGGAETYKPTCRSCYHK